MVQRRTIRTPLRQRLSRARVGALPLLVWIGSAVLSFKLWGAGPSPATYHGLARGEDVLVTAPLDGQLSRIHVRLYQRVEVGDRLATLDGSALDAAIRTARSEQEHLAAQLLSERAAIESEALAARVDALWRRDAALATVSLEFPSELRAFHSDEAALRLELSRVRLDRMSSGHEVARLEVLWRREATLEADSIRPLAGVEDLARRLARERERGEHLGSIESVLVADLERAQRRREELVSTLEALPDAATYDADLDARLAGWRAAAAVQERRVDELELRRASLEVRSPVAGRVALLHASPRQYLPAGGPILTLTRPATGEVALWVPESSMEVPAIGDRFLLDRPSVRGDSGGFAGVVLSMSPRVEPLPERLWRDIRLPEYGRLFVVLPHEPLQLLPGERIQLDPLRD